MSPVELLLVLGRLGIRLVADGERLRYFPRSAATPESLAMLRACKAELLAMLREAAEEAARERAAIIAADRPDPFENWTTRQADGRIVHQAPDAGLAVDDHWWLPAGSPSARTRRG